MKTEPIARCEIKVPKSTGSVYKTLDHLPNLGMTLAVAKRNSGKTVAICNLFRMYMEDKQQPFRILVVSATFNSNWNTMEELGIDDEDIFSPEDPEASRKIEQICCAERDDLMRYHHELACYNELNKILKRTDIDFSDSEDALLLSFYDPIRRRFRKPEHKYDGKKVCILCLIDDAQNSLLFGQRHFMNVCIKNRHLAPFPVDFQKKYPDCGSAMGCFFYICVQNYSSKSNGIPKSIRTNITQMLLWKTASDAERDMICMEVAGEVDTETFESVYNIATAEPHNFLLIDLFPKSHFPSKYRHNFNQFLIPDTQAAASNSGDVAGGSKIGKVPPKEHKK